MREDGLYGRALSRFILQALTNHPITVYGNGKQTSSFCYITGHCTGFAANFAIEKANGEVANIGNTKEFTILEFAQKMKGITKCNSKIEFQPLPKDDPKRRCPDTRKLEAIAGWKTKVSFDDGLNRTIAWFSKRD